MIPHNNWVLGDITLDDLITTCKKDLKAGVFPLFNGCRWVLYNISKLPQEGGSNPGGGDTTPGGASSTEVEALKTLLQSVVAEINSLKTKIQKLEQDNQEATKFIDVEFDNETEKTVADPFVTAASIIDFVFLNGEPNGEVLTYADNGTVRVVSDKPETGVFRLQITKKK